MSYKIVRIFSFCKFMFLSEKKSSPTKHRILRQLVEKFEYKVWHKNMRLSTLMPVFMVPEFRKTVIKLGKECKNVIPFRFRSYDFYFGEYLTWTFQIRIYVNRKANSFCDQLLRRFYSISYLRSCRKLPKTLHFVPKPSSNLGNVCNFSCQTFFATSQLVSGFDRTLTSVINNSPNCRLIKLLNFY